MNYFLVTYLLLFTPWRTITIEPKMGVVQIDTIVIRILFGAFAFYLKLFPKGNSLRVLQGYGTIIDCLNTQRIQFYLTVLFKSVPKKNCGYIGLL